MEFIIRIALMFFFIQFLVVIAIMIAALLMARSQVPVWGRQPGQGDFNASLANVMHLPTRLLRGIVRLVRSTHSIRGVH